MADRARALFRAHFLKCVKCFASNGGAGGPHRAGQDLTAKIVLVKIVLVKIVFVKIVLVKIVPVKK